MVNKSEIVGSLSWFYFIDHNIIWESILYIGPELEKRKFSLMRGINLDILISIFCAEIWKYFKGTLNKDITTIRISLQFLKVSPNLDDVKSQAFLIIPF